MFSPVQVANKSWWVPSENSQMLAVHLDNPANYQQAVEAKMESLILAIGLEPAAALTDYLLRQEGATYLPEVDSPDQLVSLVLENSLRIAEKIKEGHPDRAEPADKADALAMVELQEELGWEGFLT